MVQSLTSSICCFLVQRCCSCKRTGARYKIMQL